MGRPAGVLTQLGFTRRPNHRRRTLPAAATTSREEAERYLRDTDMPLGQLAALLGYSEQSVLTRACRRWFGTSATAQRQVLRERAAPPS
jgi:transcriptional regulator GlxA family with amidase domain